MKLYGLWDSSYRIVCPRLRVSATPSPVISNIFMRVGMVFLAGEVRERLWVIEAR